MKIKEIEMQNFMIFNALNIKFSPHINVIFGENSTGKSALIKIMYSMMRSLADVKNGKNESSMEKVENTFVEKIIGVFKPEDDAIGRLVGRQQGSNRSDILLKLNNKENIKVSFGNRQTKHLDIDFNPEIKVDNYIPIFIPPKEIISSTANFPSLYDDYHIDFEETYYDLARLLLRPLKKGPNTNEQNKVLTAFSEIMNGNVFQKDNKFYLKVKGSGEFEMGLVSEGYRKLSTLTYLILSGSLGKNAIVFWDEPEANLNPKMISHMVKALIELSKMGVQIFVTTHSYFVQQSFNLISEYQKPGKDKVDIEFFSLYKDLETKKILCESGKTLTDISHNAVMEEFDAIYDREQELI